MTPLGQDGQVTAQEHTSVSNGPMEVLRKWWWWWLHTNTLIKWPPFPPPPPPKDRKDIISIYWFWNWTRECGMRLLPLLPWDQLVLFFGWHQLIPPLHQHQLARSSLWRRLRVPLLRLLLSEMMVLTLRLQATDSFYEPFEVMP